MWEGIAVPLAAWGPVPVRLAVGVVFTAHGAQKLFGFGLGGTAGFLGGLGVPVPTVAAAVLIAVELLGGIALILGALTRLAAALLAADMLTAVLLVHLRAGFFVPEGSEFVLTLLGATLTLFITGPGAASVDAALERPRGPRSRG